MTAPANPAPPSGAKTFLIAMVSATEFGDYAWRGVVSIEAFGQRWETTCKHDHRKPDTATACARKLADEVTEHPAWQSA